MALEFVEAFGVWEEALPYLPQIVDEQEMALILAMNGQALTVAQVAARLRLSDEAAASLLSKAYARALVDKQDQRGETIDVTYQPRDFYGRLDHFAKFERWDDIPLEGRRRIDHRFLREFMARHRGTVERKVQGSEDTANSLPNDTVMLLAEIEEMIRASNVIVVQPCDCRRLGQFCDRPVETCIWLDEAALQSLDRGFGRQLSRDQALELVRWADRQGLMHTADSEWRTRGLHAICNCCACDCYPFRAAQELGSKGVWPRSRYIAVWDPELCSEGGLCVERCHFAAFIEPEPEGVCEGADAPNARFLAVQFRPERCWGCGLCANTCPTGAISMVALP